MGRHHTQESHRSRTDRPKFNGQQGSGLRISRVTFCADTMDR
jgi:hypothetical protein